MKIKSYSYILYSYHKICKVKQVCLGFEKNKDFIQEIKNVETSIKNLNKLLLLPSL
jgi:hypothetical protein